MKKFLLIVLVAWVVFFGGWFFVYTAKINPLAIQSEDTIPAMFLPITIIKERTLYADSYYQMIIERYPHPDDKNYQKGLVPFYFRQVGEHYISAFPLIAGLLSLPIYLAPMLWGIEVNWENLIFLSHLSASLIVALAGGSLYLLLKRFLNEKKALLLIAVYLFGTVNFAMVSQSLWQHGAVQLFIILSLLFLIRERVRLRHAVVSGLFLGLAVLSRPTAAILVPYFVLLSVFILNNTSANEKICQKNLITSLKFGFLFLTGLIPSVLFFAWYNAAYFLDIANQGYASQIGSNWLTPFPWGLLGLWLSPSKGILIYSPVFIFSLAGAYLSLRKENWRSNFPYLVFLSIALTYTLIMGAWKHWYGGYSFGYRMASDIIPFLVLLLVPYLKSDLFRRTRVLFLLVVIISVLSELMGLAFFDGIWHGTYDRGFWDQSWLWSIKDSETVFNIRRILLKLDL